MDMMGWDVRMRSQIHKIRNLTMKHFLKTVAARGFLLVLLTAIVGLTGASAQKAKQVAATPSFTGSLATKGKEFKAFVIKNIGKRVSLKLTFSEDNMPYGYRDGNADPVFSVDNYSYFPICGDKKADTEWTNRCRKLNWNAASKTISGFFKITEPDPKMMRTNRMFNLTPTK
jgi:hypothetical protein